MKSMYVKHEIKYSPNRDYGSFADPRGRWQGGETGAKCPFKWRLRSGRSQRKFQREGLFVWAAERFVTCFDSPLVNNRFLSALISVSIVANRFLYTWTHALVRPPAKRTRSVTLCRKICVSYAFSPFNPVNGAMMVAAMGRLLGFLPYTES